MEGSGDSVVLERLCAAFEKKGAEAEGKGGRRRRALTSARELESVLVRCRKNPEEDSTGWPLSAEMSACVRQCVLSFIHVFIHSCSQQMH